MHDEIALADQSLDRIAFLNAAEVEIHRAGVHQVRDVVQAPGRKIIEYGHLVTVLQQQTHRGATDVPCASGNQYVFRHLLHPTKRDVPKGRCVNRVTS